MSNTTDWLMVFITAVYVIATIFICRANLKSAKASKEQLDEMRRQYEEENRPILDVEFHFERRTWFIIRVVNRGKYTAHHTKIQLKQEFIDSLAEDVFRDELEKQKGKECLIGAGQHYDLFVGSYLLRDNHNKRPVEGTIIYEAKGQTYSDDFFIDIEHYMTVFSINTDQDDLLKAIKDIKSEIKNIGGELRRMKSRENEKVRNE